MTLEAAPQEAHVLLDTYWPLIMHGRRIGMGAQLVVSVDKHGNLSKPKVNLSHNGEVAKNGASA